MKKRIKKKILNQINGEKERFTFRHIKFLQSKKYLMRYYTNYYIIKFKKHCILDRYNSKQSVDSIHFLKNCYPTFPNNSDSVNEKEIKFHVNLPPMIIPPLPKFLEDIIINDNNYHDLIEERETTTVADKSEYSNDLIYILLKSNVEPF